MEILQSYAPRAEGGGREDTLIFSCYVDLDQASTVYHHPPPPPKEKNIKNKQSGITKKNIESKQLQKYSNSVYIDLKKNTPTKRSNAQRLVEY